MREESLMGKNYKWNYVNDKDMKTRRISINSQKLKLKETV